MKKFLLVIFALLNYHCWGQGNMITINSSVPSQMTICGAAKSFTISIYNPSPFLLTKDTLKLTMPLGIDYQVGSITGATELNTSILNKPTFLLADIPNLTTLNITFIAAASCDVMAFLSGGGIIENIIRVNYFANGSSNYDTRTTSSYIVRQPNLSISAFTNQSYTGNIGDVFTRCVTVTNGGLGELSQFTLTDIHGSGIQITSVDKGTCTNSGTTETIVLNGSNFSTVGDGDNLFENGESIIICEIVHVLNCISVASSFEAYWGCNAQHCQSSVSSANVVFPNLIPNLEVTPIPSMNSCFGPGNASLQQLKIINTGLGKAVNVLLDIFQATNIGYQATLGSNIDPASFTVQVGIGGTPTLITPSNTYATAALACMTSPIGRALLTVPSINSGDTVYVKWNTFSCCWNGCTGFGQNYINGWRYNGSYENICQSTYIISETWGKVYSQIYGDLTNNGSPSTLTTGQTGTFNFLFSTYQHSFPVGPGAYWKFELTLPACLTYIAGAGNLQILRSNGINTWIPSSVTTSGNIVTAIFNGNPPWDLTQAEVKINLTVDCSGCGGTGGSGSIGINSFYIPNNSCGCAIGVSCQSTAISVICPGPCPEGMIFSNYDLNRTSYGLPDNEAGGGDGLPDPGGSLDFTKIKTDRAMFGDTITASFNGKVRTSLTYPSWQFCFATSSITNGNRLDFLDATLKIYRGGLVIATCTNFTTPGNPIVINSGSTRTFQYNLSVPTVGACLPGGFVYLNNDSVVFKPRYKVTSNIGNAAPINCYATNEFFLSDIANPSLAANKFQCGNFNGNCSIIGYYFTNYGPDNYSVKSCNDVIISQNYYLSIGPCCNNYAGGNLFPYEYRNWSHISILTAIVPSGYNFISAQFNQVRTAGTLSTNSSSWVPLTPLNPNSDTLTFPVEQYFQGFGGTIPLSDDGYYGTLQVTIRPSCKVTPILSQGISNNWTFAVTPNNYLSGPGSAATFIPAVQDYIIYEAPVLFLQSTLPSINAPNTNASWDISISNTSNTSNALSTWLSGPVISGVTITQIFDLDNNVVILPIGSIYQVGTINAGVVRNFRITAIFTSCAKDSIIIYSGWNCNAGYPTSLGTYPCTPKKITLSLSPLMPALIVNVTAPPGTIQLCDTASYTAVGVNVQLGTAYHVFLIAVLPIGVSLIPGSSQLSYPVSNPYINIPAPAFMGGTTWQWDISSTDSIINANGLKGILESTLNSFKLTFKVITTCGYTSGSIIAFNLKGEAACGSSTGQEVALSSQLGITGATTPYRTAIKLLTTYISPCAGNSSMHVGITNKGPLAFGNTDSVIILLPVGVSFVPGSFTGIHNPPGNSIPIQFMLNGNSYLIWKLPFGITVGDSSVFNFGYKGNPQTLSCEITLFEAQTTSSTNVTCTQSGSNCGINIATGDTTLSVFTYKAYLSLSNGRASSIPNPAIGETVTVNLDISNTGQAILTGANSIIQFYYDTNGNGIYNTGDAFLVQDTLLVTNNAVIPYSKTFNVPAGQACSIIAIIRTAVNPCVCNPSQLLISPILITLGNDSTLCSGQTMVLSTPPVTEYTYSWAPITGLSNASISNPVLTASNLTAAPVSTNYILTTNRMGCITKDTIKITVNPIPVSNAGADITTCPVSTPGALGTSSSSGYSYNWLPGIGLSSTTASNPSVILASPGTTIYYVTTTALGCSKTDSVIVKINLLPTATISGSRGTCKGSPQPDITFTGADGTAPYTFTYTINGGANQIISTSGGDSITVAAPTSIAGTFVYALVSVLESSSTTCSQPQTGSATITVNPLPSATISGTTAVCEGAISPNIVFKGFGGIAPYTFTYKINGGINQFITSTGDSVLLAAPTTVVGTFIYSIIKVQYGSLTSCSQTETGTATIVINPSPTATISGTTPVCKNAATPNITFTGAIGTAPYTFTYTINGGTNLTVTTSSGNSVSVAAPTTVAGTFIYALVSVQDASVSTCLHLQTGTATVTVNPLPTATIAGTTAICKGGTPPDITLTGADGTAPYTFTYKVNGVTQPAATTISGNSITVAAPTSVAGAFIYSLVSVKDASSTTCFQLQTGSATVTVNPLPNAAISGTTTVCKDGTAPNITFTGSSGTAPYTFTYTINSGTNQTVSTSSGNTVNIPAPTGTAGSFTYSLVSIMDGSVPACSQTQSGSATVTVNPLPTATITGTTTVCIGGTQPVLTFSGAVGTAPYTFTYAINGVTQPTVSSTGNSVTVSAPTSVAGIFNYTLISVTESSSNTCSQSQTASATVTVNLLPTATIDGTIAVCKNAISPTITFSGANGTAPYTFTYKINGGTNQTISTTNGNSVTLPAPTSVAGTFIYLLVSVTEGSLNSCFQTQGGSAIITINPLPVANFSFTDVCLNQTLNFSDISTVSNGTIVSWLWNFDTTSPLDTTQNPGYIYASSGTYNVTLIATTNNGCKDTIEKNVVIHPLPDVMYSAANVCNGSSVYFNDLSAIPATDTLQFWTWDFGDNSAPINNQLVSHVYPAPGTYTVQLTVVSNFGCSDFITQTVVVNPNPNVNFAANKTMGCELLCVYFQDASTILTGSNAQWKWNAGDGSPQSIDANFEHCYTNDSVFAPVNFNVTLTVTSDSGCVGTLSKSDYITVYPNPGADFTAQPQTTTIIDPVISVVDASSGADFWAWDFGDLQTDSLFNPVPHTYADTGIYLITLVTSTQYGCIDTAYQTIIIEPDFAFYIPNAFSPNDDGINDTFTGKGVFITQFEMMIFDRWGNMVFYSNDLSKPWDGRANNGPEIAQADVYTYLIKLSDINMKKHKYKGIVTLVR